MLILDDIPSLEAPATGERRRRLRDLRHREFSRRTVIRGSVATASAVSLSLFGRQSVAQAAPQGYEIEPLVGGTCYQTSFYQSNAGCDLCGPSTSYTGVCETSGTWTGYHKSDPGRYKLRPDQCHDIGSIDYDGWLWKGPTSTCCAGCRSGTSCVVSKGPTVRCHDGYLCNHDGSNCINSICEWRTASGSTSGCPQ